jgi:hypothetical protein
MEFQGRKLHEPDDSVRTNSRIHKCGIQSKGSCFGKAVLDEIRHENERIDGRRGPSEIPVSEEMTFFSLDSAVMQSVERNIISPSTKSNFVDMIVLLILYYFVYGRISR